MRLLLETRMPDFLDFIVGNADLSEQDRKRANKEIMKWEKYGHLVSIEVDTTRATIELKHRED